MTDRRIDIFFYGLFMDSDVLQEYHINVINSRQAYVQDYALMIGHRATLVLAPGARAYGMVMSLMHEEIDKLYANPGLEDYRPEAMLVRLLEGQIVPALCYNLLKAPTLEEANAEYAERLRELLSKLNFPAGYIASIA